MSEPVLLRKVLRRVALELGFDSDQARQIADKALAECLTSLRENLSAEEIAALSQDDAPQIFQVLAEAVSRVVKKEVM